MKAATYELTQKRETPILTLVIFNILIGLSAALVPAVTSICLYGFIMYAILRIVQTGNKNNEAAYFSAYIIGIEMLFRLTQKGALFSFYETGKYTVILMMLIGMIIEKTERKLSPNAVLYLVLLLPSIFVAHYITGFLFRIALSFNLSGPITLAISWLYFLDRKFTKADFIKLSRQLVLGGIAVVTLILIKLPSNSLDFSAGYSNKAFSAGFGPNQVSAILGFCFYIISFNLLLGHYLTYTRTLDFIFAFLFLIVAILTFSRGGVATGILALIASTYVFIRSGRGSRRFSRIFFGAVIFGFTAYGVWQVINTFTGDTIAERYVSTINQKNVASKGKVDVSGRDVLILQDFEAFFAHPILGNGPGGSAAYRSQKYANDLDAHTEFTRLLGDHGMLGLFDFILLISTAAYYYRKRKGVNKMIVIGFVTISFLTMLHSAMRLAMPGFAFGLALIDVDFDEHPLQKSLHHT